MKKILLSILTLASINSFAQDFAWLTTVGSSLPDVVQDITTDVSGNIYSIGKFYETLDFDAGAGSTYLTSQGYDDIFFMKQDANGNLIWAHSLGQAYSESAGSIAVDGNGNVYVAGSFQVTADFDPGAGTFDLTSIGDYDNFVLKVDSNGNFLWAKRFGSTASDIIKSIQVDANNNVLLCGWFQQSCDFDPGLGDVSVTSAGLTDFYILKLDSNGDYLKVSRIGGAQSESFINFTIDNANNIIVAGTFSGTVDFDPSNGTQYLTSQGLEDLFVLKLDTDLAFSWVKSMGGTSSSIRGEDIEFANNKLYVTGEFWESIDFDPGAGSQILTSTASSADVFILQLDANGNYVMSTSIGGSDNEFGTNIHVDNASNIYVSGLFNGTTDFDPSAGTLSHTSFGGNDGFILKINDSNELQWAHQFGGTSTYDAINCFDLTSNNDIVIGGYFSDNVDFDPGATTQSATSQGEYDLFILKLTQSGLGIQELDLQTVVYPNPTKNVLNISLDEEIELISIYDLAGTLVQTEKDAHFSVETLKNGIYILRILTAKGTVRASFIKD